MILDRKDSLDLDGPQWRFALDLYGRPKVAEACLALQDEAGVDVVLLLFALYARCMHGRAMAGPALESAQAAVADWRREVVLPLRALRRRLKAGPPPAPGAESEALRNRVKAAELEAERIELAVLARWLRATPADAPEGAPEATPKGTGQDAAGEPLEALLARVLALYAPAGRDSGRSAGQAEALAVIAAAADGCLQDRPSGP